MSRSPVVSPVARAPRDVGRYRYRAAQLLVAAGQLEDVRSRLDRHGSRPIAAVERLPGLDLCRLHLAGPEHRFPIPDVVSLLRSTCPGIHVAPNYVMEPASHVIIRPAGEPEQAARGFVPQVAKGAQAGAGVRVGVIDTGYWPHPWFDGRVQGRPDGSDLEADTEGKPKDLVPGNGTLMFAAGHGTFVAGVVLQHAPGATLVARRVVEKETVDLAELDDVQMAKAMTELADVDILNLSLSTRVHPHEEHAEAEGEDHELLALMATANSLIELRRRNPGLVIVAPAGNDYEVDREAEVWPAAFSSVIAVGGLDAAGQPASFTNRGSWVDACSLAVDVESTFLHFKGNVEALAEPLPRVRVAGLHAHEPDRTAEPKPVEFTGWARWQGTSFAAPRVAGAIAALMGEGMTGEQATGIVLRSPSVERQPGLGAVVNPPAYTTPL